MEWRPWTAGIRDTDFFESSLIMAVAQRMRFLYVGASKFVTHKTAGPLL